MVKLHSLANLLVFPWVKPQVLINPAVCCICTLTEPVESCYRKFQAEAHITIEEWYLPSFGSSVLPQYSMYPNCPSLRLSMVAIATLWMSQASEHPTYQLVPHIKKKVKGWHFCDLLLSISDGINTHPFHFSSSLPSYLKCILLPMCRIPFFSASSRMHFINYSFSFALSFFN